MMISAVHV